MSIIENYLAPSSIDDAAAALAAGPATIVAGGTDLMLQTGSGQKAYPPTAHLLQILKCTANIVHTWQTTVPITTTHTSIIISVNAKQIFPMNQNCRCAPSKSSIPALKRHQIDINYFKVWLRLRQHLFQFRRVRASLKSEKFNVF